MFIIDKDISSYKRKKYDKFCLGRLYTLCVDEAAQQAQLSWSVCGDWSALNCAKACANCLANYFKRITVAESV